MIRTEGTNPPEPLTYEELQERNKFVAEIERAYAARVRQEIHDRLAEYYETISVESAQRIVAECLAPPTEKGTP